MLHGHVRPVVPGRHADLLGDFVEAVDGAAHICSDDDQGVIVARHHLAQCGNEKALVLPLERGKVDQALRGESADERAVDGSGQDGAAAGFGSDLSAYAAKVLPQRPRRDLDALRVGRVGDHGHGDAPLDEREMAGDHAVGGDAGEIPGDGGYSEQQGCSQAKEGSLLVHSKGIVYVTGQK